MRKRILLGQLGSYGDCLYATTVARQIKFDYPDCHLTWAIGSMFRSIIDGNPYVDDIWEIPVVNRIELLERWQQFEDDAYKRRELNDFDEVVMTQVFPNNIKNFDGTLRTSIFRGYRGPITVPVVPVLCLFPNEVEHVRFFAELHNFPKRGSIILFECSPQSGQSFVTPDFALSVARELVKKFPNIGIVLSSHTPIQSRDERIIDGSILSFRENAELTKYCSLMIGCSSGISWIATSDWAKQLPMIQLLGKETGVYASLVHDFEYHGLPVDAIIEMTDCSVERVTNCAAKFLTHDFATARNIYHERIIPQFDLYFVALFNFLLKKRKYRETAISLMHTIRRYGLHPRLIHGGITIITRYLLKTIRCSLFLTSCSR